MKHGTRPKGIQIIKLSDTDCQISMLSSKTENFSRKPETKENKTEILELKSKIN